MRIPRAFVVMLLVTVAVFAAAVFLFYRYEDPMVLVFTVQATLVAWGVFGGAWLLRRAGVLRA
jgi:hypothetical protein